MDTPPGFSTLPERAVRRAAETLGATRWSRRRFLTRSVVVGSALAISPWDFAVRPASAYAAVCGTDASCAAGYSVFCCTINNGANLCPPGSFAGGWWKADGSGFCCGGPRYYVDCNAACGSGWTCGCERSSATCDNRLIACNQFRYGQCHQEISCYGPVVCRLVTCTPPWEYDPSCSTSSATDDNTVSHTAPCLPGNCPSPIIMRYYDLGGPGSYLGAQEGPEGPAPAGGGTWVPFAYGAIFDVSPAGLHGIHGAIYEKYGQLGGAPGLLGYPVTDENGTPDGRGRYNHFANDGSIYWTPQTGAWSVHGAIRDHWAALRWEASPLGYPVTDENGTPDGQGRYNHFVKLVNGQVTDNGSIYWTPQTGAWSTHGPIRAHWEALGWENSFLGYPITDTTPTPDGQGQYNHFAKLVNGQVTDHGSIYWTRQTGAWSTYGVIRTRWEALGWETSPLGYPTSDPNSAAAGGLVYTAQQFQHGAIYDSTVGSASAIYGPIFTAYDTRGGPPGSLGLPTSSITTDSNGNETASFQKGTLTYNAGTGKVS
ncbi:MAG: hypothetical protein M3137_06270 [Actinomycetota bacterium]|nr:hypothetical protein [Actinomycetota bacterium]